MERIWIYPSERQILPTEKEQIGAILDEFTSGWHAHGKKLKAGYAIRHDSFIVLWVDESYEMPSGCSLDESTRIVQKIEREFGLSLFNRQLMYYRESDEVRSADFRKIDELYEAGEITDETLVFNPLVSERKQLDTEWLVPFSKSGYYSFVRQLS